MAMRIAPMILVMALAGAGCAQQAKKEQGKKEGKAMEQDWSGKVDREKAKKATAVLRVRYKGLRGGSKYTWETVEVIHVIENRSKYEFPKEMDVAHYDTAPGVPEGESTIYLEPYNNVDPSLWKLLDGTGEHGVSHAR